MSNWVIRFGQECLGLLCLFMAGIGGVFFLFFCFGWLYYFITGEFIHL